MRSRSLAMALAAVAVVLTACSSETSAPARSPAASLRPAPADRPLGDPLMTVAVKEVQAALDEARDAGYVGACRVVHVWVGSQAEKRSWANPEKCRIEMDSSVTRAGGWWFRYQARHEVAHIVTRALDHHDHRFRCVESTLVAVMGQQLVYGDDPEGYPVRVENSASPEPECDGLRLAARARRAAV
jgi:hypothetical protein